MVGACNVATMEQENSKEIWVTCPDCAKFFNISRLFFDPRFDKVKLHCPWCGHEFEKQESLKTW